MVVLFALLAVAVIGAAVLVAVRFPQAGQLPEVVPDQAVARVPADGPITAQDLAEARFPVAFRGYRMADVDALLARLGQQLPNPEVLAAPGPAPHPVTLAPQTQPPGTTVTPQAPPPGMAAMPPTGPAAPPPEDTP